MPNRFNPMEIIEPIRRQSSAEGRNVFAGGNVKILYSGYLRLLQFAKDCGDYLVVSLQSKGLADCAAMLASVARLSGVVRGKIIPDDGRTNTWAEILTASSILLLNFQPQDQNP